jgi:adenine phosphoribosyltransferase
MAFPPENMGSGSDAHNDDYAATFDIILFCHSLYGMSSKQKAIETALKMLEQGAGGLVVVFHRDANADFGSLACHQTASFPAGLISVADDDEPLNRFTRLVAGFTIQNPETNKAVEVEWRTICRALGRREVAYPGQVIFDAPNIMVAFTQHAMKLPELMACVPSASIEYTVKNREARLHRPASIFQPKEIQDVQECVHWALENGLGLTVVGGGHSGHCLWPNVIAVDMSAFDQIQVVMGQSDGGKVSPDSGPLLLVQSGCKIGDIISKSMAVGLTVPLGARPSVGAGLWLQGGIGHLARLHGLSCDSIIGAVMVSVSSGHIYCIGHVPKEHQPVGSIQPDNQDELLWAIKGAGTNMGIVISVTFKAYPTPTYSIRNWAIPLGDKVDAHARLRDLDGLISSNLPRNCSTDAYLYWDKAKLHLGVSLIECDALNNVTEVATSLKTVFGPENSFTFADSVDLFETEMYMSGMHGGHGGGKTSSFKRCLFLKHIAAADICDILVTAIDTRPSPLCYLHLLHGGGAVTDVAADASAFGCRDWDFACVITGVWPRDEDGTDVARAAVSWVYKVAADLLPTSEGVYGADLGPDPRDAALAIKAFGPNRPRLARIKRMADPCNVLAYACPIPKIPMEPKLIILVTGESCVGKDYCADVWMSTFTASTPKGLTVRVASISDVTKQEYARATDVDLDRLHRDRAFKEQHRPALTAFFQDQVKQRPRMPEEHFLSLVYNATDTDVLLITGMRDEAPVTTLSHLVPDSRLLDVRIEVKEETRLMRGGCSLQTRSGIDSKCTNRAYHPSLIFINDPSGNEEVKLFGSKILLPYIHDDLQKLANMVRPVSNFPRQGIEFRHVLGISQLPGGLALCISLLRSHFAGNWANVDKIVCCEAGGFVYASALALQVDVPLALIREAGKLPPPTMSVDKSPSNISSLACNGLGKKQIEMSRDAIHRDMSAVVVDDVLATGETLCAILQLLKESGVEIANMSVMVVSEFPLHRARQLLRQRGFGNVNVQSLLVFGGS